MASDEVIGQEESYLYIWVRTHRHRRHPDRKEVQEFLDRKGRFTDIDPSTADRVQVFPVHPPENMRDETHNREAGERHGA
jgi:hypothetical protein